MCQILRGVHTSSLCHADVKAMCANSGQDEQCSTLCHTVQHKTVLDSLGDIRQFCENEFLFTMNFFFKNGGVVDLDLMTVVFFTTPISILYLKVSCLNNRRNGV